MNSILIAWEGLQEADHELATAIFTANGKKLPPLRPEKASPQALSASIRQWARDHNKRFAAQRTAEAARERAIERAGARATQQPKSD